MQNSIRKKQIRKKQRWILLGIFCVVLLAIFLAYRYRTYHSLKTEKVIAKHVDSTTKFFAYKSGSISYNEDGISFIDEKQYGKKLIPLRIRLLHTAVITSWLHTRMEMRFFYMTVAEK